MGLGCSLLTNQSTWHAKLERQLKKAGLVREIGRSGLENSNLSGLRRLCGVKEASKRLKNRELFVIFTN
jgi:hypothetical protein